MSCYAAVFNRGPVVMAHGTTYAEVELFSREKGYTLVNHRERVYCTTHNGTQYRYPTRPIVE